jgi:hypothetical protein
VQTTAFLFSPKESTKTDDSNTLIRLSIIEMNAQPKNIIHIDNVIYLKETIESIPKKKKNRISEATSINLKIHEITIINKILCP